jgi:molecular chaperone DnaK (HSP70)
VGPAAHKSETVGRFVVGFDLGTTNSAVCYVDTAESPWRIRTFAIPQLVAPGVVEARDTLPSFHYQPAPHELATGALRLPWPPGPIPGGPRRQRTSGQEGSKGGRAACEEPNYVVGVFARDHGLEIPGRLITSAKSWLCHAGVDRLAPLLPWHGAADVERLSPVEVSARYLAHVRDAWNARFPGHPLHEQDFVLTLPASFDEIARELTVKAAALAGLPRIVLIEEPQAAFYAWLYAHQEDWEQHVRPGQKILVCDIGGGTSDFTLIRVRRGDGGKVQFHRVAVGEHLILGGDNFDLALARHLEQKVGGLEPRRWAMLVNICRQLKETLLGPQPPDQWTVTLPAVGARLIGGSLRIPVSQEQARSLVLDSFFPPVALDEKPADRRTESAEFGLPYAADNAITRYLAAFLTAHREAAREAGDSPGGHDPARPEVVLFNGGVFLSPAIRQRVLEVLRSWFRPADWQPIVLDNDRLDLAVARGAAYYGMVRRGEGVRIAAGLARTYYIGVEGEAASPDSPPSAICLLPAGIEPGQDVELAAPAFALRVSQPVEFPLFYSSTRLTDRPGELVPIDRQRMTPLPPLRTVLQSRAKREAATVPVHLHARLTEIGTLDLWCGEVSGRGSWRLQFDVRSATETDRIAQASEGEREGLVDEATWDQCWTLINNTFGPPGTEPPETLAKRLAEVTGMNRHHWPTSLCRRIWEALMDTEPGRRRGPVYEARWLNLLGFALRPGYGMAVDDWRVAETWRVVHGQLAYGTPLCRCEGWILWRRIAGGLSAGQQQAVAEPLLGPARGLHRQLTTGKGRGGDFSFSPHETAEVWRLLGSLELLPLDTKIELGNILLDLLPKRKMEAVRAVIVWAVGRIGARVPMYGPLNTVVPAEAVADWLERLLKQYPADPASWLAAMQLARRTEDRYRDLPEKRRAAVLAWLEQSGAPAHYVELVRSGGRLEAEERGLIFGESLPKGLRLVHN